MGSVSPRPIMLKSPASSPGSEAATKISPQESAPRPITKLSISRNYKIPPRPKPGRKPNTDIPPSRRKAQNREAQRAFRERKSFAVRQLEDQLAKQQQAFEMQQSQMKQQIALLQRQQNMQMKYSPHSPQSPQSPQTPPSPASPPNLQPLLAAASVNESNHRNGGNGGSGSSGGRRNSPESPGPAIAGLPNSAQQLNVPQMVVAGGSPGSSPAPYGSESYSYGFSPKSPGSPFGTPMTPSDYVSLELLDHVLDQKLPTGDSPSTSGSNGGGHHRRRSSLLSISNITPSGGTGGSGSGNDTRSSSSSSASQSSGSTPKARRNSVLRIDPPNTTTPLELVNTKWSQPAVPLRRNSQRLEIDFTAAFTPREPRPLQVRSPPAPTDRCGFCTDTSSCICAATAAREEGISAELAPDLGTLGSPGDSFLFGSPNGSTTTNSTTTTATTTPVSPASSAPGQGECTGNPGSCSQCRQDPMLTLFCSAVSNKPPSVSISPYSTYIPAQAAYKTLSRHPRFGFADLGMIVEVLQVKSSQVEVNSVAKALRILDTR